MFIKAYEKLKESGYDMFNINDQFYQDKCTPFDSSNGTDILLTDRIDNIYNNDDTQCQSNCQFSLYSLESKYISCSCSINKNINNTKIEKFNPKKIYESFYDVLKNSNFDIMKCYKILNNKNIITKNIGCIIVIILFLGRSVCFSIFLFKGINTLKIYIQKLKEKNNSNIKSNINIHNPPTKKNSIRKLILRKDLIKSNKKKLKIVNMNMRNKIDDGVANKIITDVMSQIMPGELDSSKRSFKNNILKQNNEINELKIKEVIEYKEIENSKIIQEMGYDDYELNELEYIEAIKIDKRTLFQIYWSILKRNQLIIFTFINCNDYNLLTIKLSRFIFLIVSDMALNVFFFSDDSMHKIFISYGKYDFIQQIPQITYSTIISQLIEVLLCYLSLTDKYIYQIKSLLKEDKTNNISKIIKCVNIKLYIYFAFTFLFFGVYWYIISIFCGVYRNTQIHFIKDSIISFSIGLIYPFILDFIIASLRICSLRDPKKRFKFIYALTN